MLFKSVEDQLLDTTQELKTLLTTETSTKSNEENPRITAINILKEILLPNSTNDQTLPRVSVTNQNSEPLELLEEDENISISTNNNSNTNHSDTTNIKMHPTQSQNSRYNL